MRSMLARRSGSSIASIDERGTTGSRKGCPVRMTHAVEPGVFGSGSYCATKARSRSTSAGS